MATMMHFVEAAPIFPKVPRLSLPHTHPQLFSHPSTLLLPFSLHLNGISFLFYAPGPEKRNWAHSSLLCWFVFFPVMQEAISRTLISKEKPHFCVYYQICLGDLCGISAELKTIRCSVITPNVYAVKGKKRRIDNKHLISFEAITEKDKLDYNLNLFKLQASWFFIAQSPNPESLCLNLNETRVSQDFGRVASSRIRNMMEVVFLFPKGFSLKTSLKEMRACQSHHLRR